MSHNHTFHWPAGPSEVVLTGTFDNWSQSLPLVKTETGDFQLTLPLKPSPGEDKILFKFVVDGHWTTSDEYSHENDSGNVNNVIYYDNLVKTSGAGTRIPEAGGLAMGGAGATAAAGTTSTAHKDENVKPTVQPSEEGKQKTMGEPGVVVPSDPHQIKEFNEVSNVDAKKLNEDIKKQEQEEEAAKTEESKTNGVTAAPVVPENAENVKEFKEVRDVDPKELNAKMNAQGTEGTSNGALANGEKKTKSVKVKQTIKRNKITGEEIVVSSEPILDSDEHKTLDPNAAAAATTSTTTDKAPETAHTSAESAKEESKTTQSDATPAAAGASKTGTSKKSSTPAKKTTSSTPKKEEKKGGFLKKFKKIFD